MQFQYLDRSLKTLSKVHMILNYWFRTIEYPALLSKAPLATIFRLFLQSKLFYQDHRDFLGNSLRKLL